MDSLRFISSYSGVLGFSKFVGLPLPESFYDSEKSWRFYFYYNRLIFVFLIWKVVCASVTFVHNNFEDRCIGQCIGTVQLTGLVLMVIYWLRRDGLERLVQLTDETARLVGERGLGREEVFARLYRSDAAMIGKLNRLMCLSTLVTPFVFCISTPLLEYFAGTYGTHMPAAVSCAFEMGPGRYEIFLVFQYVGLFVPAFHKLGNEFIMFALIRIQSAYFKYLSESMKHLGSQMREANIDASRKILKWIKIHQESLRNVQEFQWWFSGIVVVYYLTMIAITTGATVHLVNADSSNFLQSGTSAIYQTITIGQFYIMCHLADDLGEQMETTAREIYSFPWYLLREREKGFFQLMLAVANQRRTLTAYRAPAFAINREAFQAFIVNLVSAYMAFLKIKEIEDEVSTD